MDLLLYMVRNPGRLLTKEELMNAVWRDAAVEEGSLTQSIFLLRKALAAHQTGDSKLIVTVPGRGYQFVAEVKTADTPPVEPVQQTAVLHDRGHDRVIPWRWFVSGATAVALAMVVLATRSGQRTPEPELLPSPVTVNSGDNPVIAAAISPDGKYLAYAEPRSIVIQTLKSSDSRVIPLDSSVAPLRIVWYPDGTRLLINEKVNDVPRILVMPLVSGILKQLRENASGPAISPDGNRILYTGSLQELCVMDGNGENAHAILTAAKPDKFYPMFWSPGAPPDPARAWFVRVHSDNDKQTITLESVDGNGAHPAVALSDDRLSAFRLLPRGRLIYGLWDKARRGTDLWEMPVNTAEGKPKGPARQISHWPNFVISGLSATADGKQLTFINGRMQADVYIGNLRAGGNELADIRRLTLSQRDDWPAFWTADDSAVVFESTRNGRSQIFRQRLDATVPQLLSMDAGENKNPHFAGPWLYFQSFPPGVRTSWETPAGLRRIPADGGASVEVLRARGVDVDCASARPEICILARLEQKTLTFFGFDHQKGQGAEIARMEFDSHLFPVFSLSPDGTEIAAVDPKGQANRIRRIPLKGGAFSEVEVSGRKTIDSLFWAADGKSWFVSTVTPGNGEYLLHVNAQGESHVLLEEPHDGLTTLGVPSHSGKQLAFLQWTAASNVWMIEIP